MAVFRVWLLTLPCWTVCTYCPAWQILCVSFVAFVCNCNKETLLLLLLNFYSRVYGFTHFLQTNALNRCTPLSTTKIWSLVCDFLKTVRYSMQVGIIYQQDTSFRSVQKSATLNDLVRRYDHFVVFFAESGRFQSQPVILAEARLTLREFTTNERVKVRHPTVKSENAVSEKRCEIGLPKLVTK